MEDLTIYEIVEAVNGSYGYPSTEIISSISTDTRTITKGSVFIALKGANFDGHNFAEKAIELGATAVVITSYSIHYTKLYDILQKLSYLVVLRHSLLQYLV